MRKTATARMAGLNLLADARPHLTRYRALLDPAHEEHHDDLVEGSGESEDRPGDDPRRDERELDAAENPERTSAHTGCRPRQVGIVTGQRGGDRDYDEGRAQGGVGEDQAECVCQAQVRVEENIPAAR